MASSFESSCVSVCMWARESVKNNETSTSKTVVSHRTQELSFQYANDRESPLSSPIFQQKQQNGCFSKDAGTEFSVRRIEKGYELAYELASRKKTCFFFSLSLLAV